MVNNEMAEYRTVYVDVVYVKTDLPLQFIHFTPDNRDGHTYQNFTLQTFGMNHSSHLSHSSHPSRKYSHQLYR